MEYVDTNIMDFINRCKYKKRFLNDSQIQGFNSILCGYYCCKVIKNIFVDNIDIMECINMFSNKPSNLNKDLADDLFL